MKSLTKEIKLINDTVIQFPILPNGLGWKSTENQKLSVIESGEGKVLFSKIVKAINNAKDMVCLQSFLIQDTEIIDALIRSVKERAVKVYVLSSVEARLNEKIEEDDDFIKANYIQLLENKFKNHFIHRSAENFHGKYILIDPVSQPAGFLCTNNFTEKGFTMNPELAIELNPEQCEELFKIFVYHFWEHSTDEQTASNEFTKVKPINKFTLPEFNYILLTSPNNKASSLNENLVAAVNQAIETISFSTFLLDLNIELIKAISSKAKQGVLVALFCRPIERQFNEQLKELLEAGVSIYFHPLIHAKSLLIDNKLGFVFTANFVVYGLERGLEVGAKLNEQQTRDLAKIHKLWKEEFPFKVIKSENIQELESIYIFKDKKLVLSTLTNNTKKETRKIEKVADLLSFFISRFEIKHNIVKSLNVSLIAEIEKLPLQYKVNDSGKFEIIKVLEGNEKENEVVVIKSDFEVSDIGMLQDCKGLRIYST